MLPNEPSWRLEDTVRFAGILADRGVDLIDISSGGNTPLQRINVGPIIHHVAYQAHFSEAVRREHGHKVLVAAVGGISTGDVANNVLEKGQADVIFVGRQFQRDPATVWTFAEQLGVSVKVAHQIEWGFQGRGSSKQK